MDMVLPSDAYELGRQMSESKRLDDQGRIWSTNIGYHVHPDIAGQLPPDARVADIGCGTGAYLAELSSQLPDTTRFDGFDISSALFRSQSDLPSNVELHVADAKLPFSEEFYGVFDFIHLRLLVAGMDKGDWSIVSENVAQLLKPGGFVQWEEADLPGTKRLRSKPGCSAKRLDYMLQTMEDGLMHHFSWGFNILPGALEGAGFGDVWQDIVSSDAVVETREEFARMNVMASLNWARYMDEERQKPIWSKDEIQALVADVQKEIKQGAYVRYDIHVTIGRKSLDE